MLKFLIGLPVLGIVVLIHELGHFIAARLCGVTVESFSIGWGPVLLRKKIGTTEYRLSAIPLGGYCGMKGEQAFREAYAKKLSAVPQEQGSLFSVHPIKRILIAFAGPFANLVLAACALAGVSMLGQSYYTSDNRIVPVYCLDPADNAPARAADLRIGDRIVQVGNEKTATFADIQHEIALHPDEELVLTVERGAERLSKTIRPVLNKKTGAGQIGIYRYVPLDVASVRKDSAADIAGIKAGDRITGVDGTALDNQMALAYFFQHYTQKTALFELIRDGERIELPVALVHTENGGIDLGMSWEYLAVTEAGTGFIAGLQKEIIRTGELFLITLKSLGLLFKGVNMTDAVAGPVRISSLIGDLAADGFSANLRAGIVNVAEIVAVICVSLFLMNLLPIPVLDGGLIFTAFIECIVRRQIPPRILYYTQFIGIAFIAVLFCFALWADVHYLMR